MIVEKMEYPLSWLLVSELIDSGSSSECQTVARGDHGPKVVSVLLKTHCQAGTCGSPEI